VFEGQDTFAIKKDSTKRCNIHGEKKFVFANQSAVFLKIVAPQERALKLDFKRTHWHRGIDIGVCMEDSRLFQFMIP